MPLKLLKESYPIMKLPHFLSLERSRMNPHSNGGSPIHFVVGIVLLLVSTPEYLKSLTNTVLSCHNLCRMKEPLMKRMGTHCGLMQSIRRWKILKLFLILSMNMAGSLHPCINKRQVIWYLMLERCLKEKQDG